MTSEKIKENGKALFLKLFLNYSQILVLSKESTFNWSSIMRIFFEAQAKVGNPSDQIFSFDCLLRLTSQTIDLIYLKLILVCLLPFMLIFLLILFFMILKWFDKPNTFENLINSIIITISFVQPFIINSSFAVISCLRIDENDYYIMSYLITSCYTKDHFLYVDYFFNFKDFFLDRSVSCTIFNFVVCCHSNCNNFLLKES